MESVCENSMLNKTQLDVDIILDTINKIKAQQLELLNELESCSNEEEKIGIKQNFESLGDIINKMRVYIDVINNKQFYEN
jgi:hypothetical protein